MTRIQLRRGTAAQWTSANPVLADGEMGIETDTKKFKFGDGTTNWNNLEYVVTGGTEYQEGNGIDISNGVISIDTNVVATLNDIPDLTDYVTNSSLSTTLLNYATQSDISDMASRTWVTQQGYLTGITGAMVVSAIGYTPYDGTTNPSGFISGINSTDVINALGYTPYSSANPAGYTTNIGTVTSVNSVQPNANGNISLSKLEGGATRPTYNNSDLALLSDVTGSQGARIDDTTPSATTTYSSNKIESLIPDVSNFITSSDLSTALSDYVLSSDLATTLSGYVTNSDLTTILAGYAETSDIPTDTADLTNSAGFITISALNGYATQQWVQNQGYTTNIGTVTSVNNTQPDSNGNVTITIPDVSDMATKTWVGQQGYLVASDLNGYATESFVTSQGYITGITSSDVITALGYTPYNSTNPNSYITASALTPYALSANLATVATSGSYNDLIDKPTIPSAVTESTVSGWGFTKNIGTVTSVNNVQPDANGNVSITIPDSTTFMDLSTNQTAYGTKTFNDLRVHQYIRNSSGKMIFGATGSLFSMGDTTCELVLDGSKTRPKYYNGTTNTEIALLSDIPTVPTVDQTYNSASTNPQSGTAVEEAINTVKRNIGELVYSSLLQTDAGLHLLDGALIQGSGSYSAFVDYIADLHTANPNANYFTDETTWQNTVTQYGVCGKFVYDSTNNTVRLPKVTGIIEGTTDLTALGDLVKAGLPNITGTIDDVRGTAGGNTTSSGAIYWTSTSNSWRNDCSETNSGGAGISINASRSSSIYGNSSTVQPQTIKCFIYIVIASSTKTDIQVDIDNIATDLNGKADTDLTNVTDTAKVLMSGMGMPSNKYINLTLGASGTQYTAPANGYFGILARSADTVRFEGLEYSVTMPNASNLVSSVIFPILKGKTITLNYGTLNLSESWCYFRFIYAQGSESEAS